MENERVLSYASIAQRVVYGLRFAYADLPAELGEYRALYGALARILDQLYADTTLLDLPMDTDESFPWYVLNNQNPALDKHYREVFKRIFAFYRFFYVLAIYGEVRPEGLAMDRDTATQWKLIYKPQYARLLQTAGLALSKTKEGLLLRSEGGVDLALLQRFARDCDARGLAPYMVQGIAGRKLFDFMRGAFSRDNAYLTRRLDALYRYGGMLIALRDTCLAQGYREEFHGAFGPSGFDYSITLMRDVGGFLFGYNPRKTQQFYFGTRNGIGEKAMLENFAALDADVQRYFLSICRPCTRCGGCTNGGRQSMFTVSVIFEGKTFDLCPQFPRHEWEAYTPDLIAMLFRYHDMQEAVGKGQGVNACLSLGFSVIE